MGNFKFIDLFSGIGGFRLGLESTNGSKNFSSEENKKTEFEKRERLVSQKRKENSNEGRWISNSITANLDKRTFTCVWSNEWDKYARTVYEKHWGKNSIDPRDIRIIKSSEIPDFDFLCAGFPCQSFSIAGKRKGFSDPRGNLFFEICRILGDKKPPYFLLENVKGLLSNKEGETFKIILESLAELGYDCQWQVLNSKYFGVPQNRERVFIIGHLREKPRPEVFPIIQTNQFDNSKSKKIRVGCLSDRQGRFRSREIIYEFGIQSGKKWLEDGKELSRNYPQGQRVYNPDGISAQINSQGGGWGAKTGLYLTETMKIRRLTPLECERLQGFPNGWTEGISDTQRYKCLGNAVTVNVIKYLGEKLKEEINGEYK